MCGVLGFINTGEKEILKRGLKEISHRGPDDEGIVWFENNTGLGHRRLSIIDLSSAGHQPMVNEKGNLWIVYNGEIYNYLEIKNELIKLGIKFKSGTDTEVILYAYEVWGIDCLTKFNGMFVFGIWDKEKQKLFLARDRQGIKPCYYFQNNESLIFSSEIKAILATGLVKKEPDYYSLMTPTRFQISPYTGFKNILKLPPAHYLLFEEGRLSLYKYWDINAVEKEMDETVAADRLDYLLNDSVRQHMIADVPVGIFLSGGLDSSIIAALMRKSTNKEIHSFTIKFSEKDQKYEKMVNDSYYAKIVSDQFGFIHHEYEIEPDIVNLLPKIVYHMDEPLADPASINTYLMSENARKEGIVVILNGMGGDEIFGGYRKQLACLAAERYQKFLPLKIRKYIKNIIGQVPVASQNQGFKFLRWSKRFLSFASLSQYNRYLASDLSLSKSAFESLYGHKLSYEDTHFYKYQKSNFSSADLSYLSQICLNDTKVFLPEHNLLYSDKSTMAASIEGRPPLTDHRIIELMFSLPPNFRIRGSEQKYLLKKVSEKYLPVQIVNRPKAPFGSPLRSWIRGPLKSMVDDYLSKDEIEKTGLWDYQFVSRLIENDRKGLEDNALYIWQLLTVRIWFHTFFN